jgi:hypothetical protein
MTAGQRREALQALDRVNTAGLALEDIDPRTFVLPTLGPILDRVIDEIADGRGVTLLRGAPVDGLSIADAERLFWGLSSYIGYPEAQDGLGTRLHHVRAEQRFSDKASAARAFQTSSVRGYQTNVELQFHGDGSDALFFLCLRAGRSGGLSRVASATTAFNAVLARAPALAEVLQRPFHFDARGELGPDRPLQISPIFMEYAGRLSILYKRGYIELAERLPGAPRLTDLQVHAMDALDAVLNDPAVYHEFLMRPGDIQIANNYSILHARTAFEDDPRPERARQMLRIWSTLRRRRRALPPELITTREFAESYRRRVFLGDVAATASAPERR